MLQNILKPPCTTAVNNILIYKQKKSKNKCTVSTFGEQYLARGKYLLLLKERIWKSD
jgi:hypothetical protein